MPLRRDDPPLTIEFEIKMNMKQLENIKPTFRNFFDNFVGLTFTAECIGFDQSEGKWKFDRWNTVFSLNKLNENFEYKTGIGHREKVKDTFGAGQHSPPGIIHNLNKKTYPGGFACVSNGYVWRAKAPTPEDVLMCLASDAEALELTFEEWCGNFGCDTDSIKALTTYNTCIHNSQQLIRLFGLSGLSELRNCQEEC